MKYKILTLLLFVCCSLFSYANDFKWQLLDFKGIISINGEEISAKDFNAGEIFFRIGDTVETKGDSNSRFVLSFGWTTSSFELAGNSFLKLLNNSEHNKNGVVFHLKEGEVIFNLDSDFKHGPLHLRTNSGFMTAKGTRFYVNSNKLDTELHVLEGMVKVSRFENNSFNNYDLKLVAKGNMIKCHPYRGLGEILNSSFLTIDKINKKINNLKHLSFELFKKKVLENSKMMTKGKKIEHLSAKEQILRINKPEKEKKHFSLKNNLQTKLLKTREVEQKVVLTKKVVKTKKISDEKSKNTKEVQKIVKEDKRYYWEIVRFINEVKVKRKGVEKWVNPSIPDKIYEGDSLKTGDKSSVLLRIKDLGKENSFTQLFEKTELKVIKLQTDNLDQLEDVYLDLILGEVLVNIEKLPKTSSFQIQTPVGIAGVRGTIFSVSLNEEKQCNTFVIDGRVQFADKMINAGEILTYNKHGSVRLVKASKQVVKKLTDVSKKNKKTINNFKVKSLINQSVKEKVEKSEVSKNEKKSEETAGFEDTKEDVFESSEDNNPEFNAPQIEVSVFSEQADIQSSFPTITQVEIETPSSDDNNIIHSSSEGSSSESVFSIISPSNLPKAGEGNLYSYTLQVSGGNSPYSWTIISGTLPPGLNLTTTGVINGTPPLTSAKNDPYEFGLKVMDSSGSSISKIFTMKIGGFVEGPGWNAIIATGEAGATQLNGFGTSSNYSIRSFTEFDGKFYLATHNDPSGFELWESIDGENWTSPVSTGFGDVMNVAIEDFKEFNGNLYAAVYNWSGSGGELWRSSDGTSWNAIVATGEAGASYTNGFGDSSNTVIASLEELNGVLYASTTNSTTGAEIWMSPDGITWAQSNSDGFSSPDNAGVECLKYFQNAIFAGATNSTTGAEIWKTTDGVVWSSVMTGGFGEANNRGISDFEVFNGVIYASTKNDTTGTQVWRSTDGSTWTQANINGFGNINNRDIPALQVFQNYLYASTYNVIDDAEIWRSNDGLNWSNILSGGFSDTNNNEIESFGIYNDNIYAGVLNVTEGCELWRFYTAYLDPLITGRVYDSETGLDIDSPKVSIYLQGSDDNPVKTSNTNPYKVNVDDGIFYFRVEKAGYIFPSNKIAKKAEGDHGELFAASGNEMFMDFAMDPGYPLEIRKTSSKKKAVIGDIITYNISIKNLSAIPYRDSVEIHDMLTNGFKFVSNSSYLNETKIRDPLFSDREMVYRVINIPALSTVNLSYQVRVGVGMNIGKYVTKAYAWSCNNDWRMSDDSIHKIIIELDPLFSKGTILGKVFFDLNGNGVQEDDEKGADNVKLYMENGRFAITDHNGKYHFSAVKPGTHALKIVNEFYYLSDNPLIVQVTEGLPVKANFSVEAIKRGQKTNDKFFILSLAEYLSRDFSKKGNIEMIESDDNYDIMTNVEGRVALFLKGKVRGKYLITASFDTDRKSGKYGMSEYKNKLFKNLDPDKYYPVYGDQSKNGYEADNTQDQLYLMIEWDKSFIKWGAFNTQIPLYNRTLHGASIRYQSAKITLSGQPKTDINAFVARSLHSAGHDELMATGGRLYYLHENSIVEGSEKVRVDIKSRLTREIIESHNLIEDKDYEIDYETGRIILFNPLGVSSYINAGSILSNDIQRGALVYLVVDYEYEDFSSLKRDSFGVKAQRMLNDKLKVGGTFVKEQKSGSDYELKGGDIKYHFNKNSTVSVEFHESKNTQMKNNRSIDGGLNAVSQSADVVDNKRGDSLTIKGQTKIFNNTKIKGTFSKQDANFSSTGNSSISGSETINLEIKSKLSNSLNFGLSNAIQKTESITSLSIGNDNKVDTFRGYVNYYYGDFDFRTEYMKQRIKKDIENFSWFGTRNYNDNDLAGFRLGYKFNSNIKVYGGGQITTKGMNNDQFFIGGDFKLSDKFFLGVSETIGNLGDSTVINISKKINRDEEAGLDISSGKDSTGSRFSRLGFSKTEKVGSNSKLFLKNDYSYVQERILDSQRIGMESYLSSKLSFDIFYERTNILEEPTAINRNVGGIGISFQGKSMFLNTQIELRKDDGLTDMNQVLMKNNCLFHYRDGVEGLFRLNFSKSRNDSFDYTEASFLESGFGLSYRPVFSDKLNFISKYSYIMDQDPKNRDGFALALEDKKHVFSFDGIYDYNNFLQFAGKIAHRYQLEKVEDRDWTKSNTSLLLGRINFKVMRAWELGSEYRLLLNKEIDDVKKGWLMELSLFLNDYLKLGGGYNFTDYSDDLKNDDYQYKGWFIRAVGKY